jgi:hypothetical protein
MIMKSKEYYIRRLQEILGMPEKEAKEFVNGYLDMMQSKGFNIPGTNGYLGDLTFFGGIFYQIEMGGHQIMTPDGREARMVIVASEGGVHKNSDGKDAWKIYMLCPALEMGPLVVAYRDCETEELEILFGLHSPSGPATAESTLWSLIESAAEREKKAAH